MLQHQTQFLQQVHSRKTKTTYRTGLTSLSQWLGSAAITTVSLIQFHAWLCHNLSRNTAQTYFSAVMAYLGYLEACDLLPDDLEIGKVQRIAARQLPPNTRHENIQELDLARQAGVPQILTYYDTLPTPHTRRAQLALLRNRAMLHTLYSTACRASELIGISRPVAAQIAIIGKRRRARTLHILPPALVAIQTYLAARADDNRALFISHSNNSHGRRISTVSLNNVIKEAVAAGNLHPSLSAHDFRHYRATELLRAGMPLEVVQEYLGHADISTTRTIYAPVLGADLVGQWLARFATVGVGEGAGGV